MRATLETDCHAGRNQLYTSAFELDVWADTLRAFNGRGDNYHLLIFLPIGKQINSLDLNKHLFTSK